MMYQYVQNTGEKSTLFPIPLVTVQCDFTNEVHSSPKET